MRFRQLQRLTALSEQAVPETVVLPPPDIPPLFTLLPENALPLLTGWQQEPPEQPERWVLTFEAHYPELAALLDTLSGELTQLPADTRNLLIPAAVAADTASGITGGGFTGSGKGMA